jgi:hypothetical protein
MKLWPKKKFTVEVHRHSADNYMVAYASYSFIPFFSWRYLIFWFDQGHPGGTECWSRNMWPYKKAEEIASRLKSIEDVNEYYKPHIQEANEWKEENDRYCKKHIPYSRKKII